MFFIPATAFRFKQFLSDRLFTCRHGSDVNIITAIITCNSSIVSMFIEHVHNPY